MQIEKLTEHEDGGCTINVNMTAEETGTLLEWALQTLLIDAAEKEMENNVRRARGISKGDVEEEG